MGGGARVKQMQNFNLNLDFDDKWGVFNKRVMRGHMINGR